MENYSYTSYPDSGESSPRSREIEFENPPPWDDQQQQNQNYKAKFMCSYGGKIQPRSHDNQLSYVGGETKIFAVERNIKFTTMISKLSALCDADVTFKYQLPGEDLDALISVTNDDDLEHMMHEYDRLFRASAKPARMRLFLFSVSNQQGSFGSDRDRFVDALNTGPASVTPDPVKTVPAAASNADFLFGSEKGVSLPPVPPAAVKFHDPVPEPVAPPPEFQVRGGMHDRVIGSDPVTHPVEIQRQLQQEMQRLQIAEYEQAVYRRKCEDNLAGGYSTGDYYVQKLPEKVPSSNLTATAQPPGGFWPEKQVSSGGFPTSTAAGGQDQQVYMIPTPGTYYHAPMVRQPTGPTTQGYYTVQRMASDGYREQQVYSAVPPPQATQSSTAPTTLPPPQQAKPPTYSEGFGMVRPSGVVDNNTGAYTQVAYDRETGRQFYYTTPGGVAHHPQYQGVSPPVNADARAAQEVNAANKLSQAGRDYNNSWNFRDKCAFFSRTKGQLVVHHQSL
ncbi:Octicosapeptide/Phox/Bem1p domain-containing protein [Quillaja saponaria]|uniref:Octicosapeptide/Phox/Bem1p domain-containing protein n=1 Tax=Quillaja saponaria TaxID=32244 RepID=A0AAD7M1S6_QUISA|nr:Octicosapeptide/Phox/Bem1p domain-containing protein [Quillaja saponaria]